MLGRSQIMDFIEILKEIDARPLPMSSDGSDLSIQLTCQAWGQVLSNG